jgi:hypothetical protein
VVKEYRLKAAKKMKEAMSASSFSVAISSPRVEKSIP